MDITDLIDNAPLTDGYRGMFVVSQRAQKPELFIQFDAARELATQERKISSEDQQQQKGINLTGRRGAAY
ncbi:hypothetical protein [Paraglaciecola polaris]|uniref:Uncharacterized protein n=1 Tax=Paraglaciecola polaris LMG 21857 TaxID=1129793 RepID=K7A1W7_9ALTE|nr:hypothetical protein [Paraglaciecola polaris]GAC34923.1 hypothetical protein GPLA_4044 [Paraglaciecola polaris LMG 21857]